MNLNFIIKFDKFLERLSIKFTNRESYFYTLWYDPVMYLEPSQTTKKGVSLGFKYASAANARHLKTVTPFCLVTVTYRLKHVQTKMGTRGIFTDNFSLFIVFN